MKLNKKKLKSKYEITFVREKETKVLPLYRVIWNDHAVSGTRGGWTALNDTKLRFVQCNTVGYLVDEDEEAIALAQSVSENGTIAEIMTILKSCIIEKTQL